MLKPLTRSKLGEQFEQLEIEKSNALLRANMWLAHGNFEKASHLFAQVAEDEETLMSICVNQNLQRKAAVHGMSAMSCWAQAGNVYRALQIGNDLLSWEWLTHAHRQQIQAYFDVLQTRRTQWIKNWMPDLVTTF